MTPRKIDWQSIQAKMRRLRLLLDQLSELASGGHDRVGRNFAIELAVERILTLLVELAFSCNSHVAVVVLRRTPNSYAESFDLAAESGMISPALAADLRPSAGMRNVLVHDYLEVDPDKVAQAVPVAIAQYGEYIRQVVTFAAKHDV